MPKPNMIINPTPTGKTVIFKEDWREFGDTCGDFAGYSEFRPCAETPVFSLHNKPPSLDNNNTTMQHYGEGYKEQIFRIIMIKAMSGG
jgi:hypothetical protein